MNVVMTASLGKAPSWDSTVLESLLPQRRPPSSKCFPEDCVGESRTKRGEATHVNILVMLGVRVKSQYYYCLYPTMRAPQGQA